MKKTLFIPLIICMISEFHAQSLSFRENKGQYETGVIAEIPQSNFKTQIMENGIHYKSGNNQQIKLQFKNQNTDIKIEKKKPLQVFSNFYTNNKSILNVKDFEEIELKNLYNHTDMVLYSKGKQMEYDFILHPGANVSDIQIEIPSRNFHLDHLGNLHIKIGENEIIHQVPIAFQNDVQIASSWKIIDNQTLGFNIGEYDKSQKLIIDPIALEWYREYQYSLENKINGSCTDEFGNIYIVGTMEATVNQTDIFVTKSDLNGNLLMNVIIGENRDEKGYGIAIDTNNNILVSGLKSDITTDINAYILQLSPDGIILWEEIFGQQQMGGDLFDIAYRCSVDSLNNLYIAGSTRSNAISTPGAYQPNMSSSSNVFLAKYDADKNLLWRTYYLHDAFADMVCDKQGNVYMLGRPFGTGIGLAKFSSDGNLIWNEDNQAGKFTTDEGTGSAISISENGKNLCIASSTFENLASYTTNGVHQTSMNGAIDGIITVLDSSGTRIWGSFFGGESSDYASACAINNQGEVIVTGNTMSTTNIATPNSYSTAFQDEGNGQPDAFFTKFNPTGNVIFSTYYNGTNAFGFERGATCHFALDGNYFVTVNAHMGQVELLKFRESQLNISTTENDEKWQLYSQIDGYYLRNESKNSKIKIQLIDNMGKMVKEQILTEELEKIDTDSLVSGVYHLQIPALNHSLKLVIP